MRSTHEMKAEAILTTQTNLIEELDAGTFMSTIEIGEAMLRINWYHCDKRQGPRERK